jgi:hypothetical protein
VSFGVAVAAEVAEGEGEEAEGEEAEGEAEVEGAEAAAANIFLSALAAVELPEESLVNLNISYMSFSEAANKGESRVGS